MALGLLSHDQGIEGSSCRRRSHRNTADQWISAKGEAGHRNRVRLHEREHGGTHQRKTTSAEADRFAIHVVLALPSGCQGELAPSIGRTSQMPQQRLSLLLWRERHGGHGAGGGEQPFLVCVQKGKSL